MSLPLRWKYTITGMRWLDPNNSHGDKHATLMQTDML
jgi:hypothetical protein